MLTLDGWLLEFRYNVAPSAFWECAEGRRIVTRTGHIHGPLAHDWCIRMHHETPPTVLDILKHGWLASEDALRLLEAEETPVPYIFDTRETVILVRSLRARLLSACGLPPETAAEQELRAQKAYIQNMAALTPRARHRVRAERQRLQAAGAQLFYGEGL